MVLFCRAAAYLNKRVEINRSCHRLCMSTSRAKTSGSPLIVREMKMNKTLLPFCFIVLIAVGCKPSGILGPTDKPDITAKPWSSMEFTYWIKSSETQTKPRKINISEISVLKELSSKLNVKEIRGMSVPTGGQFILTIQDGSKWDCSIVFENRIGICKVDDNYYSYAVDLNDSEFWKMMKQICLLNEQKTHPQATSRNIILRQNKSLNDYDTLDEIKKEIP